MANTKTANAIDYRFTNGFSAMKSLEKAGTDPRIVDIEGAGMDEGRVFLHLKHGFYFKYDGCHLKSVGNAAELRDAMREIDTCVCTDCLREVSSRGQL